MSVVAVKRSCFLMTGWLVPIKMVEVTSVYGVPAVVAARAQGRSSRSGGA
jgi:hypothetical protein